MSQSGAAGDHVVPDEKDWTWTLRETCPECGFTAGSVWGAEVAGAIRQATLPWPAVLARAAARERPAPTVWSPLEYACHVRDVCRIFEGRLAAMLNETEPAFDNWDQDATAVAENYPAQNPAAVADEVIAAATAFADRYAAVPDDAWERRGLRSNGSEFTVLTLGQYALHDLVHHLWDVRS